MDDMEEKKYDNENEDDGEDQDKDKDEDEDEEGDDEDEDEDNEEEENEKEDEDEDIHATYNHFDNVNDDDFYPINDQHQRTSVQAVDLVSLSVQNLPCDGSFSECIESTL